MFEVRVHTCSLCDKTQPGRHCIEKNSSRKSRSINQRGEQERERKREREREREKGRETD